MKLQFDAKQPYQLEAGRAIADLFDGQPTSQPDYATIMQTFDTLLFGSVSQTELGIGNKLAVNAESILKNLQAFQKRNDMDPDKTLLLPSGLGVFERAARFRALRQRRPGGGSDCGRD